MNSNNFFSALPNFVSGVHALQQELSIAALVIVFAGLVIHMVLALLGRNISGMFGSLIRLCLIPVIITAIQSWGDIIVTSIQGLTSDMNLGANGGDVFGAYQAAIFRKLGNAAATANFAQPGNTPVSAGQAVPSPLPGQATGVKLTAYGYQGDLSPDSNSARGIGAFPFSSAPGSLIPGYSAALTASAAQAYNVSPGQSFTATTTTGQTYNLVYADTAPESDQRIDIYDPSQALSGGNDNNFEQSVSSVNGGPVVQGQTGLSALAPNPGGSIGDQVLWAITLGLSWIASAIMYLMGIAQQLLYMVEIALSPIFIACLMVPALTGLARRFFLTLVGITLWPLGWAVCNLVTIALINIAVNPTSNPTLSGLGTAAVVTGPLAGVAYLLVVAVWVIGSTLAAPLFIGYLLGASGGAAGVVFGAVLGGSLAASRAAAPAAGVAATAIGNSFNGHSSRSLAPNYATRPMKEPTE